jgi:hypothetical protein
MVVAHGIASFGQPQASGPLAEELLKLNIIYTD